MNMSVIALEDNSLYQTINAENAAALDKDLMSVGAFSIDQLMELAGLSVAQACISLPAPSYLLFLLTFNSIPSPRPLQRKEHPHRLRSREQRYSLLPPCCTFNDFAVVILILPSA